MKVKSLILSKFILVFIFCAFFCFSAQEVVFAQIVRDADTTNTSPIAGLGAAVYSVQFDGTSNNAVVPRSVQDDFTIEFWLKTTQIFGQDIHWRQGSGLVDAMLNPNTNDFGVSLGEGKALFGTGKPDVTIRSDTMVSDGIWHHVAAVRIRSTGELILYIDGVLEDTGTGGTQALDAAANICIGSLQTDKDYFNGVMDEIRIWNVPRSQAEIQANLHNSLTGTEPGLVAYYRLDEATGTTIYDATGNGNDGTLANNPARVISTAVIIKDNFTMSTNEDTITSMTLCGWDLEGDPLSAYVTQLPVTGTGMLFQYVEPGVPGEFIGTVPALVNDSQMRVIFVPDNQTTSYASVLGWKVFDGVLWSDNTATMTIAVACDGDTATLVANSLTIDEGAAKQLSNIDLFVNGDSPIIYRLDSLPVNGTLTLNSTPLSIGDTFTQFDVASGAIQYSHDGSETTADSFIFSFQDIDSGWMESNTFSITINPVNDIPILVANTGLTLDEGASLSIFQSNLEVTDTEDGPSNIVYELLSVPANGLLQKSGIDLSVGDTFTQEDINTTTILYIHNGTDTTDDSFRFNVTDSQGAGFFDVFFLITINLINDPPVLVNHSLNMQKGTMEYITSANLLATDEENDQIGYLVDSYPMNGALLLDGTPIVPGVVFFTPHDLENNLLQYIHNGTDTTNDSFLFSFSDGVNPYITNNEFIINIHITNDLPVLITNTGIQVDEGGTTPILRTNLETTDTESGPERITYTLIEIPAFGILKNQTTELGVGSAFTQFDINSGNLSYTHDGSETTTDSFKFNVRDYFGDGINNVSVLITINPVNDLPVLEYNNGIFILQGASATIANNNLKTTDGDDTPSELTYTVLTFPTNGVLKLDGTELADKDNTFTQADIDNNKLSYIHNDSATTSDFFTFTVSDSLGATIPETQFNISIGVKTGTWFMLK